MKLLKAGYELLVMCCQLEARRWTRVRRYLPRTERRCEPSANVKQRAGVYILSDDGRGTLLLLSLFQGDDISSREMRGQGLFHLAMPTRDNCGSMTKEQQQQACGPIRNSSHCRAGSVYLHMDISYQSHRRRFVSDRN